MNPFKIGTHSKSVSSEVQILNGSVLELSGIVKAIAMSMHWNGPFEI